MSTQTAVLLPEVEFEALLEAWERFLDALLSDGQGAPEHGRAVKWDGAAGRPGTPPVYQTLGGVE